MRSIQLRYITFAIFSLLLLSGAHAQTANETTTKIVIPGDTGLNWVNTNITVAAGDVVRLEADGQVDVGGTWGVHGPEGTTNFSAQPHGYYPLETKMRYGLAGQITLGSGRRYQPTQSWVYGEAKEITVKRSGILWLTVNDDAPDGNEGEFGVTITIVKPKPKTGRSASGAARRRS